MTESGDLGNWPLTSEFQVLWGDLDAFNHVNHTVFVKWIETARVNYFTDCGLMEMFEKEHKGPILAALSIDYHAPVFFPDSIIIQTTTTRMGASSFDMAYRVSSASKDNGIVAEATAVGVMFDYDEQKSIPIPDSIRSRIIDFETKVR